MHREVDREFEKEEEERIQKYWEERARNAGYGDEMEGEDGTDLVVQQGLLPTANDPGLWLVHCRWGGLEAAAVAWRSAGEGGNLRGGALLPCNFVPCPVMSGTWELNRHPSHLESLSYAVRGPDYLLTHPPTHPQCLLQHS